MTCTMMANRLLPDGRLDLPEITLVAATGKALSATMRALAKCLEQVRPAAALLFSDSAPPANRLADIGWVEVAEMQSRRAYARFMLKELAAHIETDFVLCVQWDGYILDARNWSEEFLAVDYVGAPWPHFADDHVVGNGGFSLRSRRLLAACADERIEVEEAEDVAICRRWRPMLEEEYGIRFAGPGLASRFAYERTAAKGDEFGFHGAFNMDRLMPRKDFRALLHSLEPGVLRRSDMFEQFRKALQRLDVRTAHVMLQSILTGPTKLQATTKA